VGLTAFDICRIAHFLGLEWRDLKGKYVVAVIADMIAIPTLRDMGGGRCVFLGFTDEHPSCSIYPVTPNEMQAISIPAIKPKQEGIDLRG